MLHRSKFSLTPTVIALLACGVARADLIAHYEFEDNVNDSSDNGYHGTPLNSPTYVPGMIGQAVDADGRAKMRTNGSIPGSSTESVSLWVRMDTQGDEVGWFGGGSWNAGEDGWMLGSRGAEGHPTGSQRFIVDSRRGEIWTYNVVPPGQWHHVVGTYNHNTLQMTLYRNGEQMGQKNAAGGDLDNLLLANQYLGAFNSGTYGGTDGDLDDLALYSRVLGLTEVKSLDSLGRSDLNYHAAEAEQLFDVYATDTPAVIAKDDRTWVKASGLRGGEGIVEDIGNDRYALQLDPVGGGVMSVGGLGTLIILR